MHSYEPLGTYKKLAKDRDVSIYQLEEEINIGRNTIYQWNKRTPSSDKLEAVANYFNVSVDYLLGRTENPNQAGAKPSDDLDEVLDNVMSFDGEPLDDHDREVIRAYLKGDSENNLKVCYMKSIKELVEEYEVELVFAPINKRACYEPVKRIIFVNQNLSIEEQEESIFHEFKHVVSHSDYIELYKIPSFRNKMEAEADYHMFKCLIENMTGNLIILM